MKQTEFKSKYARIDIREITTKNGKKKQLQFPKGTVLTVNGVEMDLGSFGSVFVNTTKEHTAFLDKMVDDDKMKLENVDRDKAYLVQKNVVGVATLRAKE